MVVKIAVVLAYVAMIIWLGVAGMRKTKSFSDFFLGGRDVGPWFTAFTYGTAYFSAVIFIGFAGKIGWAFGISGMWIALGNALIGTLLVWLLLGKRVKEVTLKLNIHTMPEYLESRYSSPFFKTYSAVAIFVFLVPYTAAVFMGLSYLFEATFGLPYWLMLAFMGVFTGIYLVMGGYKSMTMVDFIFGIIMLFGVGALFSSTVTAGGGMEQIFAHLRDINPQLTKAVGPPGIWPLFSLVFLTSVAPFGMPQLLQKFYAIRDEKSVRIGTFASTIFALLIAGVAYFTGVLTRVFINPSNTPEAFTTSGAPNFDALMPALLTKAIPGSLSILILLLMLSASMSTLAALVLISSSTVTKDLYGGLINKKASDKRLTTLMRIASTFFIILSVILALLRPAVIVTILSISWGAIASVFLGPFLWGMFTKRFGKVGAIVTSLVALTTTMVLFIGKFQDAPSSGTIGMMVSLALPMFIIPFCKSPAKAR
jgi:SSS family solute:Na+ symporter/sodium/proline symporter